MPPTPPPTPKKPAHTDHQLCLAVAHLHRDMGVKGVKRVGTEFHGVNGKKQLVITHEDRAASHAAYLDSLPDDHPDLDGPPPDAAFEPGDAGPAA